MSITNLRSVTARISGKAAKCMRHRDNTPVTLRRKYPLCEMARAKMNSRQKIFLFREPCPKKCIYLPATPAFIRTESYGLQCDKG